MLKVLPPHPLREPSGKVYLQTLTANVAIDSGNSVKLLLSKRRIFREVNFSKDSGNSVKL
jgi:hypothetical protein